MLRSNESRRVVNDELFSGKPKKGRQFEREFDVVNYVP